MAGINTLPIIIIIIIIIIVILITIIIIIIIIIIYFSVECMLPRENPSTNTPYSKMAENTLFFLC